MPTYDYGCTQCSQVFETVHKMSESPIIPCPQCGGITEKRISRGAGLVFKGGGFYVTDYASGGASAPSSSPAAEPSTGSDNHNCGGSSCVMH